MLTGFQKSGVARLGLLRRMSLENYQGRGAITFCQQPFAMLSFTTSVMEA